MTTRIRHRTAPMPLGCRWCGDEQRDHARQWVPSKGWHAWAHPTRPQINARLRAAIRLRSPHLIGVAW